MKISIIIPIYNAEKYLSRCLDSILTMKSIDWECILIDDGSTDRSWDIICEYTKKSDRFIARHKENGGVSSARNLGLKICFGDRIMFVDPDDYLFPEAEQLLYQVVTQYADYDMVLFRWDDVYPNGTKKTFQIPKADFNSQDDWIKKTVLFTPTMNPCWSRLFKQSIIIENEIVFDTTMRLAEDVCFEMEYLKYCNTIVTAGNEPFYAYCQNKGSAINEFYKGDMSDLLHACVKKIELAESKNISLSIQDKKKMNDIFFSVDIYRYIYGCAVHCSLKEFKNTMTQLSENKVFSEIIHNCNTDSDTFRIKLIKGFIRNKLFGLYWYMFTLNKYIKKIICHIKR